MMSHSWIVGLVLVAAVAFLTGRAVSEDPPPSPPGGFSSEQLKQMMEAHQKANAPGDAHKKLEPLIGKWKTATKVFMAGPKGPAVESAGVAENKWVLDGRFMLSTSKGDLMGLAYEGMGLTGFDKNRNLYVATWSDNIESHLLTMKGTVDHQTGKVFTWYGEMDEPMLKVYGRMVRYITRIIDKDKYVFEIYDLHAGENYKVVEITYTRQ